jgi:hypothetical protein
MKKEDEMERTVAFRASTPFPSQARLAAGRERLLAATMAAHGHAGGARAKQAPQLELGGCSPASIDKAMTTALVSGG